MSLLGGFFASIAGSNIKAVSGRFVRESCAPPAARGAAEGRLGSLPAHPHTQCLVQVTLSPCAAAWAQVLLNVNEPETRGVAFSVHTVTDTLGKGLGPLIVAGFITVSRPRAQPTCHAAAGGALVLLHTHACCCGTRARCDDAQELGRRGAFNVAVCGWAPCALLLGSLIFTLRRDEVCVCDWPAAPAHATHAQPTRQPLPVRAACAILQDKMQARLAATVLALRAGPDGPDAVPHAWEQSAAAGTPAAPPQDSKPSADGAVKASPREQDGAPEFSGQGGLGTHPSHSQPSLRAGSGTELREPVALPTSPTTGLRFGEGEGGLPGETLGHPREDEDAAAAAAARR